MNFAEYLNQCMQQVNCSASELSRESGLSQAVISRYRSSIRVPSLGSEPLSRIIKALAKMSQEREDKPFTEEELTGKMCEILRDEPGSVALSSDSLNDILISMDINIKKLSQSISYDPSYLSRIRSGQRRPSNPITFVQGVISYLMDNCDRKQLCETTSRLSGRSSEELAADEELAAALTDLMIRRWDSDPADISAGDNECVLDFVRKLSEFDLDEYIRAIHFDTLRVPTSPVRLPASRVCYGIEDMKQCELDFFRQTVLSRSQESIYMCSDMDMEDMAQDVEFGRKWMFAIAASIKKGLRLNVIHTLDRPLNEMMLGLEAWIPLYMTGQVSSWYLPGSRDKAYSHLHYASGAAALSGECIRGHHDSCRYYLTNNRKEISFYRNYCEGLFDHAKPLMAIFTRNNRPRFENFMSTAVSARGSRRLILCAPPLSCISHELLNRILKRSGHPQAGEVLSLAENEKKQLDTILSSDICAVELCAVSREEFEAHPAALSLSGLFPEHNIFYTYEEYREHLAQAEAYFSRYPQCTLTVTDRPGFRNIRIHILKGRWAMVSKNVSPAIHFVIRHPKLRRALENMELPVVM